MTSQVFPLRKLSSNFTFNIISKRWFAFSLSIILMIGSIGLLMTRGLNFGIDFTGGIVMEARIAENPELSEIRSILPKEDFGEVALQRIGEQNDIMIRLQASDSEDAQAKTVMAVKEQLEANISSNITWRKVDYVGPQVGRELIRAGALSLGLAFAAMLLYIWMRFEWQFSIGAIAALIHDSILTLGFYSLLGLEFNLTSIAAILTIIGYSINDTVVIYDRIRENLRKYKKKPLPELLNSSINETLSRTLLTAGTTIAALVALAWVGSHVIEGFSLAVLFGVIIGTYSSIYVAAPFLISLNLRKQSQTE